MKGFILLIVIMVLLTIGVGVYFSFNPVQPKKPAVDGPFSNLTQPEQCYIKARDTNANPATIFCTCMGGSWRLAKTPQGEDGRCKIEGVEREYGEWEYFRKMNPMDNTLQRFEGLHDDWVDYCKRNKTSVYCIDNNGNSLVR